MKHLPRKILQTTLLAYGLLLLNACGGGGSSTPTTTQQVSAEEKAIETIMAYAESDGKSTVPTVQDYAASEVAGIDDNNIDDINQIVENLTPTEVNSKEKLQLLADGVATDTEKPVFTSSATASVDENQLSAITLIATDNSNKDIKYDISGADASSFSVDNDTGVVVFKSIPDFESGKTTYNFTATATDEANNIARQDVTINIKDVDENIVDPLKLPKFSNGELRRYIKENTTKAITLSAKRAKSYSISGDDANQFNINTTSGEVTFKSAPDYESGKRSYVFKATAINSFGSHSQKITIVVSDEDDSVMWKGRLYQYVKSPKTRRIWLDRNLGAYKVCETSVARNCFGDYYQWGRATDGHESYNSAHTVVLADKININHNLFIRTKVDIDIVDDWITRDGGFWGLGDGPDNNGQKRSDIWSKTDGTSVCPTGFRVPASNELADEFTYVKNKEDALNNFLKLPASGYRYPWRDTKHENTFVIGYLWSTGYDRQYDKGVSFRYGKEARMHVDTLASAIPIRCIKKK